MLLFLKRIIQKTYAQYTQKNNEMAAKLFRREILYFRVRQGR